MIKRWKILVAVLILALFAFIIGNNERDVLEIHNNGSTMCMNCIGLE